MDRVVKGTRALRGVFVSSVLLAGGTAFASTAVTLTESNAAAGAWSFTMGAAIPTLGEWAVIVLLGVMGAVALWQLRKRPGMASAGAALLVLTLTGGLIAGIATSPLGVAGHEPTATVNGQTMRSPLIPPTGSASVQIVAQLEAEPSETVTGMTLHYQKEGDGSWQTVTGAQWGLPTCANCWAADLPLAGYAEGDSIRYFVSAQFATAGDAYLFDGESPANTCAPVDCSDNGECLDGTCVCDEGYAGVACDACDTGYEGYPACVESGPSCPTGTDMVDNGDGTVTDPVTCLVWEKTPSASTFQLCTSSMDYNICPPANRPAELHCLAKGAGWRVPTISELRALVDGCDDNMYWNPVLATGGACGVTDDCLADTCGAWGPCAGCPGGAGPGEHNRYIDPIFASGHNGFWSSSPVENRIDRAWRIDSDNAYLGDVNVINAEGVRCVRAGP